MQRCSWFDVRTTFLLFFLLSPDLRAADAPPPPEAFGRVPQFASIALSPDGRLLAWGENSAAGQAVVMHDLTASAEKRRFAVPADMRLRDLLWADNETLLVTVSATLAIGPRGRDRYEWSRTYATDVAGGPLRMLLMRDPTRSWATGSTLVASRVGKPKTVIMASWDFAAAQHKQQTGSRIVDTERKDAGWVYSLFEVDTRTGKGKPLQQGTPYTLDWIVSGRGEPVARSEWDADRRLFRVLRKDGGGWKEIHRQEDGGTLALYGLSQDEAAVVAVGAGGQQRSRLWAIPLDGSGARLMVEDAEDVEFVVQDRFSLKPVAARSGGLEPRLHWLDAAAEARARSLARTFGGLGVDILGASEDGSRVVARASSHSQPATYYVVDFSKRSADILGEDYPALVNVPLGQARAISYAARDGTAIPAYLTLPPSAEAKALPLVVLPHGGPEARDEPDFDWAAQFLATRGYLVLQPQFRGSTGFGAAFRRAGYRQWGGLMQDDVSDGVKWLIDQGMADPKRVCIVGMSYGGYAALAGAAFTPDLFACAASVNGISDLPSMLAFESQQAGEASDAVAYWRDHIGSPHDPDVIAKSPARAAENVRAPVLLIHAVNDTVVPISQSEAMSQALTRLGKQVAIVKLDGEDHWLSRSGTRVQVLTELEKFLGAHLGTRGVPAGAEAD
jgi:dipeptidyl aminopeptidase/acylaminoacyl peptidase